MNKKIILFYGPLGQKNKTILGGGESGNLRTIQVLKNNRFNVTPVQKPYHLFKNPLGEILYLFHLSIFQFYFFIKILSIKKSKIIHISGYYCNIIYFEYFMLAMSRILGAKVLYEVRAGGLISSYKERSSFYKYILKKTFERASVILIQGECDLRFVRTLTKQPVLYYPNYINDNIIQPLEIKHRVNSEEISLVYFGRIAPSKRIDFMIEICGILHKEGFSVNLELIGNIDLKYSKHSDRNYLDILENKIKSLDIKDHVTFTPGKKQVELFNILKDKHFFIFPTMEKREGHSNSLTEAMSCGVVPIASPNGFNKSVIGIDELVIDNYNSDLYARRIIEIWRSGCWSSYAKQVYNRVINNYTESKVSKTLLQAYNILS